MHLYYCNYNHKVLNLHTHAPLKSLTDKLALWLTTTRVNKETADSADKMGNQSLCSVQTVCICCLWPWDKTPKKWKYIPVGNGIAISRAAVCISVYECTNVEEGKVAEWDKTKTGKCILTLPITKIEDYKLQIKLVRGFFLSWKGERAASHSVLHSTEFTPWELILTGMSTYLT